jgi:hypothetical protein
MTDLDAQLRAAHDSGDAPALVALYQQAALETGHPETAGLRAQLVAMGRELTVSHP